MIILSFLFAIAILPVFASREFQESVRITAPPKPTYTGILRIPDDAAHRYIAAGNNDIRGPCPALNTLANHGYIPRTGIASFEQMVEGITHGLNMEYNLASFLAAFGILVRGNAYINKLSIGLDTSLVPPLPGKIDGPKARGLAAHGRFEGDVSMTRQDAAIGDHINFQPNLFAQLLEIVSRVGDNSSTFGPRSIVNEEALSLFKLKRFQDCQRDNSKLVYHFGRVLFSYGDTGLILNFFANGTDGTVSVPGLTTIFRDQRFPDNWYRRSAPGTAELVAASRDAVLQAHPVRPGANSPNGTYIPDSGPFDACAFYNAVVGDNVPGVLLNTTGILKENVDFLLNTIHIIFAPCPVTLPHGPANV